MTTTLRNQTLLTLKWKAKQVADGSNVAPKSCPNAELRARLVTQMARIRVFEQKLLRMFADGQLFGTTHTCIGQEAGTVALYEHLDPNRDAVFTNLSLIHI